MEDIAPVYGKTYHMWQVDRGDPVPMGPPQLMGSFVSPETVEKAHEGGMDGLLKDRDERFGVDYRTKAKKREGIAPVEKHPGMLGDDFVDVSRADWNDVNRRRRDVEAEWEE
jgi:hypothetical protein